jgi:peptidoglycan/LPS O-acetylase OafA/YrhL
VTDARSGYLPTLDGWRAVAIGGVILAHSTYALLGPGGALADPALFALTRYGAKGVDLFFGISGFLITARLIEEHERRGRIGLGGFYVRRFCRILPPYFVLLAFFALAAATGLLAISRRELLASAVFLRNYVGLPEGSGWYTGHLWSLAVEEHFYLLWPTLLTLFGPPRARRWVIALAIAVAAWRVADFRLDLVGQALPGTSFYVRTDTRLDSLFWGCWAALLVHHAPSRAVLERALTPAVWYVIIAALLANWYVAPPLELLWQSLLIAAALTGTVLRPAALPGRMLEAAPLRWVGRISYSLYLWQQPFLVGAHGELPLGALQHLPLNLVALFAVAAASYYLVERPMIRVGHRLATPVTPGRV